MWKQEALNLSGTPIDQSNVREFTLSLGDWPEGGARSLTFGLLALSLATGVFHVHGFTGLVVVLNQESGTVGVKLSGLSAVLVAGVLGENCFRKKGIDSFFSWIVI